MWILGGFIVFVLFVGGGESDPSPDLVNKSQPLVQKRGIQPEPTLDEFDDEIDDEFDLEVPESWTDEEDLEVNQEEEVGDRDQASRRDVIKEVAPSREPLSSERVQPVPTEVALKTPESEVPVVENTSSEESESESHPFLGDLDLDALGIDGEELREYVNSEDFGSEYAD